MFVEQDDRVAAPRGKLTTRAYWWAIAQIRREHASINGIRRQLCNSYSRGGGRDIDNIWDLCRTCNRQKGAQTLDKWNGYP
ncbi:HNH endonuclease [Calidifontibacter indicus]|uniref:HNH endonuclease n=1 Tax=Calidifontibacter indicus TaxID=419650 RepID=UPI003D75EBE0